MRLSHDWTSGPCEFGTGEVTFTPSPRVSLCRKPGTIRRDVMWVELYACDECYARWKAHPNRKKEERK